MRAKSTRCCASQAQWRRRASAAQRISALAKSCCKGAIAHPSAALNCQIIHRDDIRSLTESFIYLCFHKRRMYQNVMHAALLTFSTHAAFNVCR
ncbi:hypothetical protein PSAB6_30297 [Paraburkholderia sabiae]|nr:hypothetical protein PSAB6_30297 [Paraburkholderia sabiae]